MRFFRSYSQPGCFHEKPNTRDARHLQALSNDTKKSDQASVLFTKNEKNYFPPPPQIFWAKVLVKERGEKMDFSSLLYKKWKKLLFSPLDFRCFCIDFRSWWKRGKTAWTETQSRRLRSKPISLAGIKVPPTNLSQHKRAKKVLKNGSLKQSLTGDAKIEGFCHFLLTGFLRSGPPMPGWYTPWPRILIARMKNPLSPLVPLREPLPKKILAISPAIFDQKWRFSVFLDLRLGNLWRHKCFLRETITSGKYSLTFITSVCLQAG